jgi:hypothetical protein
MVFPVTGGTQSTGYEISNSLRLNDDDSPYLSDTPGSAGNRRTFTISLWAKRSDMNTSAVLYGAGTAATDMFQLLMQNDADANRIIIQNRVSGTNNLHLVTTNSFRDPSAWYHIVLAVDTTQSTSSNRAKLYVNGTQITAFDTEDYPSEDYDCHVNNTVAHHIGAQSRGSPNDHFDGYITELHSIDGSAKAQTDFGEFNNNGVWIPKAYTGTYGTNGFFMEFKQTGTGTNASGIGADTSGNDNHFAVNNLAATDITEDTCTNNFATLNGVDEGIGSATLSEGNCKFVGHDGGTARARATQGVANGKWYAEFRVANNHKLRISVTDNVGMETNGPITNDGVDFGINDGYLYTYKDGSNNDTGAGSVSGGIDLSYTHSSNDIIGVALDADNDTVRFYVNGSAQGSEATVLQRATEDVFHLFSVYDFSGSGNNANTVECNFGNPSYSISSGNNDGKYGNFEYAPPSGYYALCTKRLAEFG